MGILRGDSGAAWEVLELPPIPGAQGTTSRTPVLSSSTTDGSTDAESDDYETPEQAEARHLRKWLYVRRLHDVAAEYKYKSIERAFAGRIGDDSYAVSCAHFIGSLMGEFQVQSDCGYKKQLPR